MRLRGVIIGRFLKLALRIDAQPVMAPWHYSILNNPSLPDFEISIAHHLLKMAARRRGFLKWQTIAPFA